ncbi:hypothetical protein [Methylocaldum sp.]|uniref:hypothetical protein n=1 Tax=Methylocaldum sp. TaxID=1969727 RepID=UPI002D2D8262|nr:hypothetical protein [Methylocaldum sp.]HYE38243.1 hypothetical protein [Methylocaldum sp.]
MKPLPRKAKLLLSAVLAWPLLTAGMCASTPRIEVREVQVPVPVPCAVDPGPDPVYADTDEALRQAPDLFGRAQLLVAGRLQRMARERELKAANEGCR